MSALVRASTGRSPHGIALAALALLLAVSAAQADPAPAIPQAGAGEGPVFRVSRVEVRYEESEGEARGSAEEGAPSVQWLLEAPIELARLASGLAAPEASGERELLALPRSDVDPPLALHASALGAISRELLSRLRAGGFLGVYVAPDEHDIDLARERDLRKLDDTVLRFVVRIARVRELRSVGFGSRLPEDWRINHKAHRRIRELSPIQPESAQRDDASSLLREDVLDDYLYRLNRHPGRRVDAGLAPSEDGRGIALDYRVAEARPWYVYAQTSNTGSEETNPWQTRVGVVHQQLTDRDDVLSVDYLNAGLNDVHAVSLAYEMPWLPSQRPSWMRKEEDAPDWLASLPWIGSDRVRVGVSGSWSRTQSSSIDDTDDIETDDWDAGGRFTWQAYQRRNFFLDSYAGLRLRGIELTNEVARNEPNSELLILPEIGVALDRSDEISQWLGDVALETNVRDLGDEAPLFGRIDPSDSWRLLRFEGSVSQFLEPLFHPSAWENPSSDQAGSLAHEVSLRASGQWSFDARLVPQVSQVIGGLYSVRGYPQSLASGDSVVTGSFEYRFHLARSLPVSPTPLRLPVLGAFRVAPQQSYGDADWDLTLIGFVDAGRTWKADRPDGSFEQDDTLVGAGIGAELSILGRVRARVDVARALHSAGNLGDRTNSGTHEIHMLFSVVY